MRGARTNERPQPDSSAAASVLNAEFLAEDRDGASLAVVAHSEDYP
jgi:hypothetical protein